MEKQGQAVVFEQVRLSIDRGTFLKTASPLVGLTEPATENTACTDQSTLTVPDMDRMVILERPGTGRLLSNCRLQSVSGTQSTTVIEIRAEFIENGLSRASFRFREAERQGLLSLLQQRFGPGDDIELTEQVLLEENKTTVRYWRDGDELWLLYAPESASVLLVHQDLKSGLSLPPPKEASKRGEPVSLDDIGIGKLDLKAPLPTLDLPSDAPSADTGAADTATD